MKYILFIIGLYVLTGCSLSTPAMTQYTIKSVVDKKENKENFINKNIKVLKPYCANSLESYDLKYRQGDNKIFSYTQSLWADSPNNAIGNEIVKVLRESNMFKSVQNYKSLSNDELILETNIEEFMQYFDENLSKAYCNVSITFTILDSSKNIVIDTKNFNTTIESKTLDANGGVIGLNQALSIVLENSIIWLKEVLINDK